MGLSTVNPGFHSCVVRGWLRVHHFICEVRIAFPTCIFDIYLYWISSAISYVISFHKVLLQFLSQPLSSLPRINWYQQTSSPCFPRGHWEAESPNLTSRGDRLSVLQVCASPSVNWSSVVRWWLQYAVKWICMRPVCSRVLIYREPEQAMRKGC